MEWTLLPDDDIESRQGDGITDVMQRRRKRPWIRLAASESIRQSTAFHLHGALLEGSVAFRKKLSREKVLNFLASQLPCMVAMEACASICYRAGRSGSPGHEVRLIPPVYVKPFVKRQKNDTAGAKAICGVTSGVRVVAPQGSARVGRLALALEDPGSGLTEPVRESGGLFARADRRFRRGDRLLGKGAPHRCVRKRGGGLADDDP